MVMVGLFGCDGVGRRWRWRCVVMRYDALLWVWLGWDGGGDGGGDGDGDGDGNGDDDDVMRCDAMPCHEVGVGFCRGRA